MEVGQKAKLRQDVFSMFSKVGKEHVKYGSKGETVTVVSDR